jgi:hypothetical protein
MKTLTDSQIAVRAMFNTYPCLKSWLLFIKQVLPKSLSYDTTSCAQIALISKSAMQAFDYIAVNEDSANIIRVSVMLTNLQDSAWRCWTTFTAQSKKTESTKTITINSTALQGLTTFHNWDNVLDPSPSSFSPDKLLETILKGVKI